MKRSTLLFGVLSGALFLALTLAIRDSVWIWWEMRLFGLVSFAGLFATLAIGEIRMLLLNKGAFPLFRYHKPIAIWTVFLVLLHFLSAILDRFKWGKATPWTNYLGFSYGDQYLVFLSLGALALYLLLLVAGTSATRSIQALGFKRWKLIHYLAYPTFMLAYVHAVNLGTDLKHSAISPVVSFVVVASFLLVVALLITRVALAFGIFESQWQIAFAAAFVLVLFVAGTLFGSSMVQTEERLTMTQAQLDALEKELLLRGTRVQDLTSLIQEQQAQLQVIRDG